MPRRAELGLILGLVAMAYVAPWAFLAQAWRWVTRDPAVSAFAPGVEEWSARTMWLALFVVVALVTSQRDRWLGVMVGLAGAHVFIFGPRVTAAYFLIGALVVYLGASLSADARERARMILGASALVQAGLVFAQASGLWSPYGTLDRVGTLGVTGLCGAYLVMTGLLLRGTLPLLVVCLAVLLTHSTAAVLGLLVGLLLRARLAAPWIGGLVLVALVAGLLLYAKHPLSLTNRYEATYAMVREWAASSLLWGRGLGAAFYAPVELRREGVWVYAHSDLVAWVTDTGLLGLVSLGAWGWTRRRLILVPSIGAMLLPALTWYPLHVLTTGLVFALILGLSMADTEQPATC